MRGSSRVVGVGASTLGLIDYQSPIATASSLMRNRPRTCSIVDRIVIDSGTAPGGTPPSLGIPVTFVCHMTHHGGHACPQDFLSFSTHTRPNFSIFVLNPVAPRPPTTRPHPPHCKWRCSGDRLLIPGFTTTRVRPCGVCLWVTGLAVRSKEPTTTLSRAPQPQELLSPSSSQVRLLFAFDCVAIWYQRSDGNRDSGVAVWWSVEHHGRGWKIHFLPGRGLQNRRCSW